MTVKELKEFLDTLPEDAIVCNRHMLGGGSEIIYIQENEDKFTIYSTHTIIFLTLTTIQAKVTLVK